MANKDAQVQDIRTEAAAKVIPYMTLPPITLLNSLLFVFYSRPRSWLSTTTDRPWSSLNNMRYHFKGHVKEVSYWKTSCTIK